MSDIHVRLGSLLEYCINPNPHYDFSKPNRVVGFCFSAKEICRNIYCSICSNPRHLWGGSVNYKENFEVSVYRVECEKTRYVNKYGKLHREVVIVASIFILQCDINFAVNVPRVCTRRQISYSSNLKLPINWEGVTFP